MKKEEPMTFPSKYFTVWLNACIYASIVFSFCLRLVGESLPSAGVFVIMSSVLLGVLGNDYVKRYCESGDGEGRGKSLIQSNFRLHVLPLILSVVLLCFWRTVFGEEATWESFQLGIVYMLLVFVLYMLTPLKDGSKYFTKLKQVYQLENPVRYVFVASLLCVASGLVVVHGK